jgi:hypothetical protein
MRKSSIKNLIEFRRFSKIRKASFVRRLKTKAEDKSNSDGGNYWVRSITALSSAFRYNDNQIVKDRLEAIQEDFEITDRKQTKVMYQRNMDILYNFEDYDFSTLRPSDELTFLSKPKEKSLLDIGGLPIQIIPNHIFSYEVNDKKYIGGIWFVTWLDGYKKSDLGINSEAIFTYLKKHYSKDYKIMPKDCIVVDASSMNVVTYQQIVDGEIPSLLGLTIAIIRGMF